MPFCRPYRQSVYDCRRISGFPVFAITVALSNLFGVGGGSLMSRCLGEGDEKSARQVSAFSLYGSLAGALVFPSPSISCAAPSWFF